MFFPVPSVSFSRAALRRIFLAVTVAAVAACGKKADAPSADAKPPAEKIRFATDWYPQPEHGGYYNALVRGYYAAAGLDVEILPGNPRDTSERRVATGSAQLGMAASDATLIDHERGLPIIALGTTLQHDPQAIMVHADSAVKSFADLSDHRVSVAVGIPWFRYIVLKYKLQNVQEIPLTYTVANFIHDPTYIQQAFVTSEPYFVRKQGVEPRVLPINQSGYDAYRVLIGSKDYVAKNPDAVRRFVEASLRGWREYMTDPAAANAEILKRNPEMTPELAQFSWQALRDGHYIEGFADKGEGVGQMNAARWQAQYDALKQVGVLQTTFDPKDAYTLDFIPKP